MLPEVKEMKLLSTGLVWNEKSTVYDLIDCQRFGEYIWCMEKRF